MLAVRGITPLLQLIREGIHRSRRTLPLPQCTFSVAFSESGPMLTAHSLGRAISTVDITL